MSEVPRVYSERERDRVLGRQIDMQAKLFGILHRSRTSRVERLVARAPITVDGRVGINKSGVEGFTDQELRLILDGSVAGLLTLYLARPYGETIGRPCSDHSDFGVPLGEPAGDYEALRLDIGEEFSANRLFGLATDWQELAGLSLGRPLEDELPDALRLANICHTALSQRSKTYEAVTPNPQPMERTPLD